MAIFGFKKSKDEKMEQAAQSAKVVKEKKARTKAAQPKNTKAVKAAKVNAPASTVATGSISHSAAVIIRPRVTEKSGILAQSNVYTFEVSKGANKNSVAKAVTSLYKVVPVKVAVINTPMRNVFVKGKKGTVAGIRKALVTLKGGDKIDFV